MVVAVAGTTVRSAEKSGVAGQLGRAASHDYPGRSDSLTSD